MTITLDYYPNVLYYTLAPGLGCNDCPKKDSQNLSRPDDDEDLARDPDFPDLPDLVRSINSLSGSSFRSHSHSNDCDRRWCPAEQTLSLENDESREMRHFSCVGSNVVAVADVAGGAFDVSMMTGGGWSAFDSLQQHLATIVAGSSGHHPTPVFKTASHKRH